MKVAVFCGVREEKYFVRWYIIILWSGVRIPPLLPEFPGVPGFFISCYLPEFMRFCDFTQIVLHILDIISDIENMFTCVILLLALHYEL